MGGYRWGLNKGTTDATLLRDNYYWIGANYQATAALGLTLAYYYDDIRNVAGFNVKNPWQVTFIADYAFSKRTDVYLTTAYSKNSGLNFDVGDQFCECLLPGGRSGQHDRRGRGVRHRF
jgi:predicted porin